VDSSAAIQHVLTVTVGTGYNARGKFAVDAETPPQQPWTMLKHYSPARTQASLVAQGVCNVTLECNLVNVTFQSNVTAQLDQPFAGCYSVTTSSRIGGMVRLHEET
jgi:hypothetical protein